MSGIVQRGCNRNLTHVNGTLCVQYGNNMLFKVRWGSMGLMSGCPKPQWKRVDSATVPLSLCIESFVDRLSKSSNYSSSRTMGDTKYLNGNGDADTRKMWTDYLADKDKQTARGESRRQNNNVDGV